MNKAVWIALGAVAISLITIFIALAASRRGTRITTITTHSTDSENEKAE